MQNNCKIIAITQARSNSTRLPNKVKLLINELPLLTYHLQRAKQSKLINDLCVATTTSNEDKAIVEIAKQNNCLYFQGSEDDVLERYYQAALKFSANIIVRITSDCPLIDPKIIDLVITNFLNSNYDYYSNVIPSTFPDGIDVEIFKFSALEKAYKDATLKSEREHVTPYIWKNSTLKNSSLFVGGNLLNEKNYSNVRLTVDTKEDFELIELLINKLGIDKTWQEYANYVIDNKININTMYNRN